MKKLKEHGKLLAAELARVKGGKGGQQARKRAEEAAAAAIAATDAQDATGDLNDTEVEGQVPSRKKLRAALAAFRK